MLQFWQVNGVINVTVMEAGCASRAQNSTGGCQHAGFHFNLCLLKSEEVKLMDYLPSNQERRKLSITGSWVSPQLFRFVCLD